MSSAFLSSTVSLINSSRNTFIYFSVLQDTQAEEDVEDARQSKDASEWVAQSMPDNSRLALVLSRQAHAQT